MLDSQTCPAAVPSPLLSFAIEGARRDELRRGRDTMGLRSCEGTVGDVTATSLLVLGTAGAYRVSHTLPADIDFRGLAGQRVRLTLREQGPSLAPVARTLSLAGSDGTLLLVAHDGRLVPEVHLFDGMAVSVALSQRRRGALVLGTRAGMGALAVGERALLETSARRYGAWFLGHSGLGMGSYVIAHASLLGRSIH